ncbi:MAG: D-glycero-beta-D-manno-heptose-7-phosphate kinase [Campylobacterales bacterium]|nr:D-glycero-beta-D-manno-heptose-7-phosphate kinase [Campylobacterales bacterium]
MMKILVIGDLMLDRYLWGKCERISPEAPVQVVDIAKESTTLGGAGNVINNLLAFGAKVGVISVIGDDDTAIEIQGLLTGVEQHLITQKGRKTSQKSRIMASHQQVVRYDKESKEDITQPSQDEILTIYRSIIHQYDSVILSDYGKGILTSALTQALITIANEHSIKVLADPKGSDYTKYTGAYLVTPNKKEAQEATQIAFNNQATLLQALQRLQDIVTIPLITLSEEGIALLVEGQSIQKPTVAREVYDVTGAGDTVIASLAYSLAQGKDIITSVEFANLAAGVVVGKLGSATATLEEIEEYKSSLHKSSIESHIKSFETIAKVVERLKAQNKKIVFTNGCFDILHRGHVAYLDTAKSFGDVLILGLNSDESVRRLKGESRPINTQKDRAFILAALESVDYVVIFDEDTPYELIKIVKPDILVKGGDYQGKEVVGSDIAKQVKLVDFVEGRSTTKTIAKIQADNQKLC